MVILPLVVPCLFALAAGIYVAFRCHSRFCPTCGNMYSIDRTTSMSFKIISVQHRHCVFTIARELRPFFLMDRSLLNCLFPPLTASFYFFFINLANRNFSFPVSFAYCIPLVGILNGTLISTVLFLRVGLAILSCGGM